MEKNHDIPLSLYKEYSPPSALSEIPLLHYEPSFSPNSNLQTSLSRSCSKLMVGNGTTRHVSHFPSKIRRETNPSCDSKPRVLSSSSKESTESQSSQLWEQSLVECPDGIFPIQSIEHPIHEIFIPNAQPYLVVNTLLPSLNPPLLLNGPLMLPLETSPSQVEPPPTKPMPLEI
ncbi:hypothetical protein FXO37_12156 [Capsicum annuum]|nr:hypothetical protein FXO37_12156 [Capsicum annuum]